MEKEINAGEAKICIDKGAVILDVRTKEEYERGHIEGSKNIDIHDATFVEQVEKFDRSQSFVVYCASGARSLNAIQMMIDMGFGDVHSMSGGIADWKKEGMEVVV
ncbi:MAG TPA: rhodanese-like domain-containing protein [Candidatus Yonathbacteria bacterium]|nr:rhodanese-like domain-containing protein [Candidatus Yonathbacteria bacterium]